MKKNRQTVSIESVFGVEPSVAHDALSVLTHREREVANALATGKPAKEIAAGFGISPKTLDIHRANIKIKLRARSAVDIVRFVYAERLGRPT